MNASTHAAHAAPLWTTAALPEFEDSTPAEAQRLGAHLDRCRGRQSRLFAVRCAVETARDAVSRRFVTTLVVAGGIAGVASTFLS